MYFYNIKFLDLKEKGKNYQIHQKKIGQYQILNLVHLLQKRRINAMCYEDNNLLFFGKFSMENWQVVVVVKIANLKRPRNKIT